MSDVLLSHIAITLYFLLMSDVLLSHTAITLYFLLMSDVLLSHTAITLQNESQVMQMTMKWELWEQPHCFRTQHFVHNRSQALTGVPINKV